MTAKHYIPLFLVLAGTLSAPAQDKHTKKADQHYERLEYINAAEEYEKLISRGKADAYVYGQAANSYYQINNTKKAESYYKRVVSRRNTTPDPEVVYSYAQTLKANGKAAESNTWMDKFAELAPNDSRAVAYKANPNYIPRILEGEELYEATLIKDLQSDAIDFGGERVGNTFYFTSSRGSGKRHKMNNETFLSVYEATITGDRYGEVREIKGDVNSKYHEGVIAITPDGKRMYFDRNDYYKGKYKKDETGVNQLNIYYAEWDGSRWGYVQPVPFNDSEYSMGHPALSPDGNTLYFVSDMPGSLGASDIYRVSIKSDGSFSKPENLGPGVNTEGKEVFPSVGADGTLYFSSNGHLGLGGLDVFAATPQGNGFGAVRNMGTPINSSQDDFAFKLDQAATAGYVSSNRGGADNIYAIKEIEICASILDIVVVDEYTNAPIGGAAVSLNDANANKLSQKAAGQDGKTDFSVECDYSFVIDALKDGYEPGSTTVSSQDGRVVAEIALRPIEEIIIEDKIVLNPILFDFDKHNIKPQAALELDKVVQIMKKYPKMVVKVEGHTDSRGSAAYNKTLSDRRAKSAVQYIISQGVEEHRISGEGFGQERPIEDCGANCTEVQHDTNRRSEFIIVER